MTSEIYAKIVVLEKQCMVGLRGTHECSKLPPASSIMTFFYWFYGLEFYATIILY